MFVSFTIVYIIRCLHYFLTNARLRSHSIDFGKANDCTVLFLKDNTDKWLFFRCFDNQEQLQFVVYAYLECILEKKKTTTMMTTRRQKALINVINCLV